MFIVLFWRIFDDLFVYWQSCKLNAAIEEEFEDTNGIIRIRKSKKDRQYKGQKKKDKRRSTKHYTEN
jgi:hypothetical protein